ncbi:HAD-IB family phosphatase [Thermithiobacillus plumbiphilus]|uniref:HAD-IB family phosphatase n=1 Tax=Thermithiobacillus plumbiphilus TaxID=1729899 RepID=A0ABU9D713_9PROT
MEPESTVLSHPRAVICDVGHTIVMESVLNRVLTGLGKPGAARVLYDRAVLDPADEAGMEQWVEEVVREKIDAMHGCESGWICQVASQMPLTPGFDHLVKLAKTKNVPVMLVGAVPRFVTEALVRRLSGAITNIVGTEVAIKDGRVDGTEWVCTPSKKVELVTQWLRARGIPPSDAIIIGDSIGDIPIMHLVPKANRIAFNSDDPAVLQIASRSHQNAMYELSRELFE